MALDLAFTDGGWDDYLWYQSQPKSLLKRVNDLIKATRRTPYEGIGQPEQLRYQESGTWSRRITGEHRLVYRVQGDTLVVIQARFHYGD